MGFKALLLVGFLLISTVLADSVEKKKRHEKIPTTLEGPFKPYTKKFDKHLPKGSDDLPLYDPRVVKRVAAIFPEQIVVSLSTPDAMWISWVSGKLQQAHHHHSLKCYLLLFRNPKPQCGYSSLI